jgi:hypothetical protein
MQNSGKKTQNKRLTRPEFRLHSDATGLHFEFKAAGAFRPANADFLLEKRL